jgi:hypothetical protein
VTPKFKWAVPAVTGLVVIIAVAGWLLWLMPPPHRPFEYMIAGTGATAVALGALFAGLIVRKNGYEVQLGAPGDAICHITRRIVRGNAPPS